jgi:hypothetical protein
MSYAMEMEEFGDFELEEEMFLGEASASPGGGSRALATIDSETAAMMMDVAAQMAAEAESEEEADAFLPLIASLAPMAFKAFAPLAKSVIGKFAPTLSKGVLSAGRKMLRNGGQKGIAALPDIARGVARDTVQAVADGRQVTGRQVMRSAAQHTLPFLQDPAHAHQAAQQARRRLMMARRPRPQPSPYYGQPYPPQDWDGGPPDGGYNPYGGPFDGSPYGSGDYGAQAALPPAQADGPAYPQWFS